MKKLFLIKEYIYYFLHARNAHGVHSPFIYDLVCHVLNDKREFYGWEQIQQLRKGMLADNSILEVEDYGAGSHVQKSNQRCIRDIASIAGRSPKYGRLLFRLVDYYRLKEIIELGTSLGLATCYMAMANKQACITTIEGSKSISDQAKLNFSKLDIQVNLITGNFDNELEPLLKKTAFELLFIDGNHRKEPTLQYFQVALPYARENSWIIFDDIHWSPEMKEAWNMIRQHEAVRCSIDLFQFGIILFRKDFKEKQHFILRY